MICLFNNKATMKELIETNGDYVLTPICTYVRIKEIVNIDYSCQFTFEIAEEFKEGINKLVEDALLKVKDEEGDEFFRIVNVRKSKKSIEVFAVHITIRDTVNMWLEDVRPENKTGDGAIKWIFDNAKGGHTFNVSSNITSINTAYYQDMNVYNALYGADNCFLNRWGGETKRRGFNIAINDRIGQDRGMQIRSKKNLTGFEASTNIDDLCTVLYVKGFDGIKLLEPVISPLANLYSKPYYKEIKYEDVKVKTDNNPEEGFDTIELARAELKRRALLEFSEKHIDTIKATYNIKFAQLEQTEEYKNYSMIETAFLGDTVEVIEDNFGINIKVRVIEREYDVLAQKRISTVLSNTAIAKPVKVEDILKELEQNKSPNGRPNLSEYVSSMINSGMKDSYVVLKPNELLIMDSKDINTAKNVTRYNKNGLGFSQTGYFGEYTYGFTIDGKINADLIVTGTLVADLIKSGVIHGKNSNWNLDNGTMEFLENGNKALDISTSVLSFYNWKIANERIGAIASLNMADERNIPSISLFNSKKSYTSISYEEEGMHRTPYVIFDKFDISKDGNGYAIRFFEPIALEDKSDVNGYLKCMGLDNRKNDNSKLFAMADGTGWATQRDFVVNGNLRVVGTINGTKTAESRIQALENLELQKGGLL